MGQSAGFKSSVFWFLSLGHGSELLLIIITNGIFNNVKSHPHNK